MLDLNPYTLTFVQTDKYLFFQALRVSFPKVEAALPSLNLAKELS